MTSARDVMTSVECAAVRETVTGAGAPPIREG